MGPCKMMRVVAEIEETPLDDWILRTSLVHAAPRVTKTAAEAYAHLVAMMGRYAEAGISTVTTIEWKPRTRVGRMVARAIAGEHDAKRKGKIEDEE